MIITHKLEMDMTNRRDPDWIHVVQGDSNTRLLELTLYSGGEAWPVPEGAAVFLRYCKSDGTKGIYDTMPDGSCAWTAEENRITLALAPQVMTVAGAVVAQVELVEGTDTLATFSMVIHVERDPAVGVLKSEDYIHMLDWMELELEKLLTQARDSGEFTGPQGEKGDTGDSVFEYAQNAGYGGTEAEFALQLVTPALPLAGGTMTGTLDMGGQALTGLAEPSETSDAATKAYVDARRTIAVTVLKSTLWSEELPYTQTVSALGIRLGDFIRLEPNYKLYLEQDLAMKAALDCISYVNALDNRIMAVCLENKPETDLEVYVEGIR